MTLLHALPSPLLTRSEMAAALNVSVKTIDRLKGAGMPYVTYGRRLTRYEAARAIPWALDYMGAG